MTSENGGTTGFYRTYRTLTWRTTKTNAFWLRIRGTRRRRSLDCGFCPIMPTGRLS